MEFARTQQLSWAQWNFLPNYAQKNVENHPTFFGEKVAKMEVLMKGWMNLRLRNAVKGMQVFIPSHHLRGTS